ATFTSGQREWTCGSHDAAKTLYGSIREIVTVPPWIANAYANGRLMRSKPETPVLLGFHAGPRGTEYSRLASSAAFSDRASSAFDVLATFATASAASHTRKLFPRAFSRTALAFPEA